MVCLITGSSRGLGKATALALGQRGHRVVVHYKERHKEANTVSSQIKESIILQADARNFSDVKTLVGEVIKQWGGIDVLVNNAGITKEGILLKTSEEELDEVIDTNLKGAFNFIRAVAPYMMKRKSGQIINIASYTGLKGKSGLSAYAASKAGLIGLTVSAARELSEHNIMVNAVLPGYMLTDMGAASTNKGKEAALKDSLIKSFSEIDNVAEFICYLTGTKGITGQVFNLDSRVL